MVNRGKPFSIPRNRRPKGSNHNFSHHAMNKVDAANNVVFVFKYDANDRLTNRWTPAKTNAFYSYDAAGNLTNIAYAVSLPIRMAYDAVNRLTNMVDAAGNCSYAYTSFGALQTEDGPWGNDTVTYSYNNQLRSGLSLDQPNAAPWRISYGYDGANRLHNLTAPERA